MKLLITSIKAALLSSSLLSMYILFFVNTGEDIILLFPLSILITFFIASGLIFFTIVPFTLLENNNTIFKKYFPFYAIVFFSLCLTVAYNVHFEEIVIAILTIAYITAMQSWVWFFKPTIK